MTTNKPFSTSPIHTTTPIKAAQLADNQTSKELVADDEEDAFYFRSIEAQGIYLNRAQIDAVRHINGPCLVLAGAGSGKTRVLTSRAAYLITVKKVEPKRVMLVTFTKKAADEMKTRLATLPGLSQQMVRSMTIGTFHAIFLRLLRSRGFNQRIISSEKRKQVAIKLILKEKALQDSYEPESLLAILSSHKTNLQDLNDLPTKTTVDKEIKDIFLRYEQWKKDNNLMDFDDMLVETYRLLTTNQRLLQLMQNRFSYILCDEWQDTNPIQFELIKLIAKPNDGLFVVGDDDQTIYSFNGADSNIILNFEKLYPNTKLITLDINYRSHANIIGLANEVITRNKFRKKKTLKVAKESDITPYYLRPKTTEDEADLVIKEITAYVQIGSRNYRDFAILHRTNSSSRAIFDQLVIQGIPFITYTKEETFYEQAIVKPVIDYLRLTENPANLEAIPSILPTLFLRREVAMNHIKANQIVNSINQPIEHLLSLPGLKSFQKKQLKDRLKLIVTLKKESPIQAIKKVRSFYDNYLEANERQQLTLHKEMILETLSELEASAKKFTTIKEFLDFIEVVINKNNEMETIRRTPNANAVSLMTIHRSKGLEFPVIFLTGASEKILPHSSAMEANERNDLVSRVKEVNKSQAAMEEERRLAYVAITRAEEELFISSPIHYRGEQLDISRFILDPFTSDTESKTITKQNKSNNRLLVWNCTNPACICWMRINSHEEAIKKDRECPKCKQVMKQTIRDVELNQ